MTLEEHGLKKLFLNSPQVSSGSERYINTEINRIIGVITRGKYVVMGVVWLLIRTF